MGQQQTATARAPTLKELEQRFSVEADIPETNCVVLRQRSTGEVFAMKEISITSTEEFGKVVATLNNRKLLRNDHYLSLEQFFTKSETSFCSIFHKVTAVYQYSRHTLRSEVEARLSESKQFEEKELWSILCSCCLAISYLLKSGVEFKLISTREIFLTADGVVKVGDPDLLSVNLAGPVKSLVQYYPPEFLNFHRQSVSGCVFSLGMCIMEIVFLEALTDCYDYQEHSFNEQAFHARINRLKAIPELSDNFVQVLLKMLSISEKQRPSMQELEQHLVQVVDAPGSSSSQCQSETKQNKPQSEMVAAQPNHSNEPDLQTEVLSQPAQPMIPQTEIPSEQPPTPIDADIELPDEADDKSENILTDRSNNFPNCESSCNKAYLARDEPASTQKEKLTSAFGEHRQAQPSDRKNDTLSIDYVAAQKNISLLPSYPTFNNRETYTTTTVANFTKASATTVGYPAAKESQELFTDPKLLAMVRHDLEEINMRRSMLGRASIDRVATRTTNVVQVQSVSYKSSHVMDSSTYEASLVTGSAGHRIDSAFPVHHTAEQLNPYRRTAVSRQTDHPKQNEPSIKAISDFKSSIGGTNNNSSGIQHGQPQLIYVSESYTKGKYQGQKKGKARHGFGTFYYKQGGKYTGEWVDNKMSGKGILYYIDDKIAYDGQWRDDRLWGYGVLFNEDPKILDRPYDYRSWDDVDEYWIRYEGSFVDDNKDGRGKLFLSNGEVFEGWFQNDYVTGEGTFHRNDGKVVRGVWKNNQLVEQY